MIVYLLVFRAYINEMHDSRGKIPSKISRPYIYDVKFLALLRAPHIYDISRLRVKGSWSLFGTVKGTIPDTIHKTFLKEGTRRAEVSVYG